MLDVVALELVCRVTVTKPVVGRDEISLLASTRPERLHRWTIAVVHIW